MISQTFEGHDIIYQMGDQAHEIYIIKEGEVELLDENNNVIDTLSKDEIFGKSIIIISKTNKYSNTARAKGEIVKCLTLTL